MKQVLHDAQLKGMEYRKKKMKKDITKMSLKEMIAEMKADWKEYATREECLCFMKGQDAEKRRHRLSTRDKEFRLKHFTGYVTERYYEMLEYLEREGRVKEKKILKKEFNKASKEAYAHVEKVQQEEKERLALLGIDFITAKDEAAIKNAAKAAKAAKVDDDIKSTSRLEQEELERERKYNTYENFNKFIADTVENIKERKTKEKYSGPRGEIQRSTRESTS